MTSFCASGLRRLLLAGCLGAALLGPTDVSAGGCMVPAGLLHDACVRNVYVRQRPSGLCALQVTSICGAPATRILLTGAGGMGGGRRHAWPSVRSRTCFEVRERQFCD